jgi:hypothetical protein
MSGITYDFDYFSSKLDHLPSGSQVPIQLYRYLRERELHRRPFSTYLDRDLFFFECKTIDLSFRPRMLDLVRVFLRAKDYRVTREELIRALYLPTSRRIFISFRYFLLQGILFTFLLSRS